MRPQPVLTQLRPFAVYRLKRYLIFGLLSRSLGAFISVDTEALTAATEETDCLRVYFE
jgi:hypothetical protein